MINDSDSIIKYANDAHNPINDMRDITIHKCKYAADLLRQGQKERNKNSNWNGIETKQKSLSNYTESSI